ncbi:hypothetical protein JCM10450v2_003908 [Rhodotorula kratochvilovae]
MPRSSSISHIPPALLAGQPTSAHPSSPPSAPGARPRLAKASSFADLRLAKQKLLARFTRSSTAAEGDELWGCAGALDEESERASEDVPREILPDPPARTAARTPTPRAPRRPTAPYAFPLNADLSAEELRRLERLREAELAAAAALDYTLHSSHARKSSRSSSAAQIDTSGLSPHMLAGAIERLNLGPNAHAHPHGHGHAHKRSLSREVLEPAFALVDGDEGRGRANSVASLLSSPALSECSSRPRTNDSLPSFAESASTVDSTGSFPPSPVQSPTLRSRPTFSSAYREVKVDSDTVAAQPRSYAFI